MDWYYIILGSYAGDVIGTLVLEPTSYWLPFQSYNEIGLGPKWKTMLMLGR